MIKFQLDRLYKCRNGSKVRLVKTHDAFGCLVFLVEWTPGNTTTEEWVQGREISLMYNGLGGAWGDDWDIVDYADTLPDPIKEDVPHISTDFLAMVYSGLKLAKSVVVEYQDLQITFRKVEG